MNGYSFTTSVRDALVAGREEAFRLRHEYVGTEHMLLGLLRTEKSVAGAILARLQVSPDRLREEIEAMVQPGAIGTHPGPDLPYTSRAKKVLELSMVGARELGHNYVGTDHLLLGLMREEKGMAAQVLAHCGATAVLVHDAVVELHRDGARDGM